MDELKGPHLQIILHIKEGLGFGFLRNPIVVTGSLSGYKLDTDPVVASHTPSFDAELVWEADKRRFRSLRVQNVPVKVEVYALGSQGRRDRVGYLLLSLLGAQPCPANRANDVKYSWHKLLGVKSEGKCCHPQLLMSLSIEDRVTPLTPRNDLQMFHDNDVAYASSYKKSNFNAKGSSAFGMDEGTKESKKSEPSPKLQPILIADEGFIQVGDGNDEFILKLTLGTITNLQGMLPESTKINNHLYCSIVYSVFRTDIKTISVPITEGNAVFDQRTELKICSSLSSLMKYFSLSPNLVVRVCVAHADIGGGTIDLRRLVPTDDLEKFIREFGSGVKAFSFGERLFVGPPTQLPQERTHLGLLVTLSYLRTRENVQKNIPPARSATELQSCASPRPDLKCRAASCATLPPEPEPQPAARPPPLSTASRPVQLETSKSDTCMQRTEKDLTRNVMSPMERSEIMQKAVDELEDWKEKQQELYKYQLKRKEEYHLDLLSKEWSKRRLELETKLQRGIEQCRTLAANLARATDDFRLRGFRSADRESKLFDVKKALETEYSSKYQALREASQKMEDDMNHRIKLKDMLVEELQVKIKQLHKNIDMLKDTVEKDDQQSGLTKDQTAGLIRELRCLEEKLEAAVQSKAFFKEQWSRAVRELHIAKLRERRAAMMILQRDREGLGATFEEEEGDLKQSEVDIKKLKDDYYVDILANTPALDPDSIIGAAGLEEMDFYEKGNAPKDPVNDKLNELILKRDALKREDNPDEKLLKELNREIRNMLLNSA
ncbi:hypothetical protein ACJJTC_017919 [Scirpophaga incertulas]